MLLRLFQQETGSKGIFDTLDLLEWWTKKLVEPDDGDAWISTSQWRLYARHIHAMVAVNDPCIANAVAYDLGIESPLIPKPETKTNPDGTVSELWTLEAHGRSIPPFGFETWQSPLKLTRFHPCDMEDFDLDLDMDASEEEQIQDNQSTQPQQLAKV
ncbi:MAG: hypothetical protein B7X12_00710 [Halothiobacillus sp. 20-53-49]|nr:MAG: hypothetical protein B7X12_00710 [Halothiobacillus sp. 20-53-49]